jgi:flagellar biosynthesis protein
VDDKQNRDKAVALRYDAQKDEVPVVVAKGQGYLAERIREVARQSGVPIRENKELADYLMSLDLFDEIPPELYTVVAEVLAYIYRMDQKRGRG